MESNLLKVEIKSSLLISHKSIVKAQPVLELRLSKIPSTAPATAPALAPALHHTGESNNLSCTGDGVALNLLLILSSTDLNQIKLSQTQNSNPKTQKAKNHKTQKSQNPKTNKPELKSQKAKTQNLKPKTYLT